MRNWWPIVCLSFFVGQAQLPKSADSLQIYLATKPQDTNYVLALNEYSFIMVQEGKFDEAQKNIARMDALSKKLDFKLGFYKTTNMRGVVEYLRQNHKKAMEYFLESTQIIQKYKLPKKTYQNALNNIGIIYSELGDREKATQYSLKLIEFQEKHKLEPLKANPYEQIANNLKFYKKYQEALPYYQKALAIVTRYKDFTGMAVSENSIGNLYDDLQNNPEATRHYLKGLQYAEKADYKLLQTDLLINLGRMYRKQNDFAKAEANFRKSEAICLEIEVTQPLNTIYHNLGDLYFFQNKMAAAETYYLKSLAIAKTIEDIEHLYSINQALADLYEKTGNYKAAFRYKVAADATKDSIFKLETAAVTEDLLRKYETGKKEQQIAALSAQNTINSLRIRNANRQKIFFIVGLALLAVIIVLVFRQSRNRKKTNEKLHFLNEELNEANKVKARFLGIINHDLKSPVSSLISFLHIQKDTPEALNEQMRREMQDQTITSAEDLLESMDDILLWSKGQMDHFKPEFRKINVDWLFNDLRKHFSHVKHVDFIFENVGSPELFTDENYLKTILRNLMANAVKALENTPGATVTVKMEPSGLSVSDNGPGGSNEQFQALYDKSAVSGMQSGMGLHLIRDLVKAIGWQISVDSAKGTGTTFRIVFG